MSVPRDILRENPGVGEWAVLHAYRGSIAHGMYVPQDDPDSIDDKDTMAFCVPPPGYFIGLRSYASRGTKEIKRGEWDIVVYEIRKGISLLKQGNPNVLSMLWVPENYVISMTEGGKFLRESREAFVGRHVFKPFIGYATAQLYKMEHQAFEGYMGDKRKQLVEQHGYDTKNAAHCIRLLRMGIEFLRDGELNVLRHDSQELLAIKRGEWPLTRVKEEATRLLRRAEDAYDRSTLRARPDDAEIDVLCKEIVHETWKERRWA